MGKISHMEEVLPSLNLAAQALLGGKARRRAAVEVSDSHEQLQRMVEHLGAQVNSMRDREHDHLAQIETLREAPSAWAKQELSRLAALEETAKARAIHNAELEAVIKHKTR